MVTDRVIVASNGRTSVELTAAPFFVKEIKGFDKLKIQNITTQGYDQDGAALVNSYVLPRDMEIKGQIRAGSARKMQALRDQLNNMFVPKKDIIITHHYGGKTRMIRARVEETPAFGFEEVSTVQSYSIQAVAMDPYWTDTEEALVEMAKTVGRFHFPLRIPAGKGVVFGLRQTAMIANVYNASAVKVGMRYVFLADGVVVNPMLFNIRTRQFMRLCCTMEAGETITVQTGQQKTITRNRNGLKDDYIGKIDLAGGGRTFLELDPGDNLLRYGADDGEKMLRVKIYHSNQYMGV
ncbi:MAG: phage tail family protein [Lachnospiraceae bacterium]|nr:phage tail family protein [Lachnospiraceae bacterium]MCM1239953.1 phage tail family protein [Lachnospiraceae bacterium]